jgi:undecaprenyl-diphosphatase
MIKYIFLGVIQGLTEFLPISSSGHLVLAQHLLGITENQLAIAVILHLGTGMALIIFFFQDLLRLLKNFRLLMLLSVTTVITGVVGFLGKDLFESLFSSPRLVAVALGITGIMLLLTRKFMDGERNNLTLKDAVILGCSQSLAIIPGISRSGATISTLLWRKIDKYLSFRLSFLVALPVIFGAAILEARHINFASPGEGKNLMAGFIASFLVGMLALNILKISLQKARLHYFGYYCICISLLSWIFLK